MRMLRCSQPEATLELLYPYLLEDSDYTKEVLAQMLHRQLTEAPQETFVLVAIDENELLGFVIVIAEYGANHTFVLQAWASNKAPETMSKKILSRVIMWSEDLGRTSIKIETKREDRGISRRFGFTKYSSMMELKIGLDADELTEDASIEIRTPQANKGNDNGKQVEIKELHSGSDNNAERVRELHRSESGDGSDSIRRAEDGGSPSGNATDPESASVSGRDAGVRPAKSRPVTIAERQTIVHPRS